MHTPYTYNTVSSLIHRVKCRSHLEMVCFATFKYSVNQRTYENKWRKLFNSTNGMEDG